MREYAAHRYHHLGPQSGIKSGRAVLQRLRLTASLTPFSLAIMLFRLSAFTALLAALPAATVFGGQVPIVNGVLGGVQTTPKAKTDVINAAPAATTPGKLRVVQNSGVCETTPGVNQASGYGDLASDKSIWCVFALDVIRMPY